MATRTTALQAVSWAILVATLGGAGVLGYRASQRELAPPPMLVPEVKPGSMPPPLPPEAAPAADAGSTVEARREACRQAVAEAVRTRGWRQAERLCQENEVEARGDPELRLLLKRVRCGDWEDRAARYTAARRLGEASELEGWLKRDCGPEAGLKPEPEAEVTDPCDLRPAVRLRAQGAAVEALAELDRCRVNCATWDDAEQLRRELEPEVRADGRKRCGWLERGDKTEAALRGCEQYVKRQYCRGIEVELPPRGKTLRVRPGAGSKNAWSTNDRGLMAFLIARAQANPRAGPYRCGISAGKK